MESTIKSYEDACAFLGMGTALPTIEGPADLVAPLMGDWMMSVINKAMTLEHQQKTESKEVFPDYTKWEQRKNFAWWEVEADEKNPSGSGLSYGDYVCANAVTDVGSRFCLPTPEMVKYSADQFKKLHELRLIGKPIE